MRIGTRTPRGTVEAERNGTIGTLRGRVLEIGAGDDANLGHLARGVEWVGLEPARRRRERLAATARSRGVSATVLDAIAEHDGAPAGTATATVFRLARPFTKALDHGCDPTRNTEATVRASALEVADVVRYEVPALGLAIPYVLIHARRRP